MMTRDDMRRCQEFLNRTDLNRWKCSFKPDERYGQEGKIANPLSPNDPITIEEFHQAIRRNHP